MSFAVVDAVTFALSLRMSVTVSVSFELLIVGSIDGVTDAEIDGDTNGGVTDRVHVSVGDLFFRAMVIVSLRDAFNVRVSEILFVLDMEMAAEGLGVLLAVSSRVADSLREDVLLEVTLHDIVFSPVVVSVSETSLVLECDGLNVGVDGIVSVLDVVIVERCVVDLVMSRDQLLVDDEDGFVESLEEMVTAVVLDGNVRDEDFDLEPDGVGDVVTLRVVDTLRSRYVAVSVGDNRRVTVFEITLVADRLR